MKSSIYVSAEQIQVIGHLGSTVRRYVTYPLPEGTMYNGTITDSAFLIECLMSLKREHSDLFGGGTTLIVDGSTILSRRIASPNLNHKQYLQLVRDDFADSVDSTDNLVCGYHRLPSAENAILACAVNKAQVDSYISTFNEAGIRLSGINIGVDAILGFVKSRPDLQQSTIVINVIDGLTMLSMLFENGNNIFISRSRLYGEEKEQVYRSVLENLNGLIQFTRSQKISEITRSYYMGISDADMQLLDAFNPHTDIALSPLSAYLGKGELPPEAHFASLNMLFGGGIDLLAARIALDKYVKSQRPKKLWIPFLAIYILVLAAIASVLGYLVIQETRKINEINEYIKRPAIVEKLNEIGILQRETRFYNEIIRQVDEKADWEESMPLASSRTLNTIIVTHGVDVEVRNFEFNADTGVLRVRATCEDATVASDYVDALYDFGVAQKIEYRGYGSTMDGDFVFTIDITLKTGGAR